MVYGIYQSAAGLQVNQYRQAVLANNLANVNTAGFKHDLAIVRERQVASQEDLADPTWSDPILNRMTGGSFVAPTYTGFEQGTIEHTGGALDVALAGDGFFAIQDGDEVRYTRDGRFTLNERGELVTVAGHHPVLSDEGEPIVVPANAASSARIEAGGEVRAGNRTFGRVEVVGFDDTSQLVKLGGNRFKAVDAEPVPLTAQLRTGAVEASNADPTRAMVDMIEVSRAYEMNARLIGLADATLGRAVNDIARLR
jgi:flagellar basal-body rod protein FlgG